MNRRILFFALGLCVAQTASARSAAEDEREIRRVEGELCKAFENGDGAVLRKDLDATFTLTNSRGVVSDFAQNVAEVEKREPHLDVFRNHDQKVRLYGDSAIVTGVTTVKGTAEGNPFAADSQFTDTYVYHDNRWLLAASHASRLPAAQPAVSATGSFTLPLDPSRVDASGQQLYIDDSIIKATIPSLKGVGPRHTTCANSMIMPPILWITFRPTVTGSHSATMNGLACKFAKNEDLRDMRGSVECSQPESKEYAGFDDDPDYYFAAAPDVDAGEALELFRALRSGMLSFPAHFPPPDLKTLHSVGMYKKDGYLMMNWGGCGCTQTLKFKVRHDANATSFVSVGSGSSVCI